MPTETSPQLSQQIQYALNQIKIFHVTSPPLFTSLFLIGTPPIYWTFRVDTIKLWFISPSPSSPISNKTQNPSFLLCGSSGCPTQTRVKRHTNMLRMGDAPGSPFSRISNDPEDLPLGVYVLLLLLTSFPKPPPTLHLQEGLKIMTNRTQICIYCLFTSGYD